jgi:hypothetical protein
MFCNKHKPHIGQFALLDLAKKFVEESDIFNIGTHEKIGGYDGQAVLMSKERISLLTQSIEKAMVAESLKTARGILEDVVLELRFHTSKAGQIALLRQALLDEIDALAKQLPSAFPHHP